MTTILMALDHQAVPKAYIDRIHAIMPDAEVIQTDQREEIEPALKKAEIITGFISPQMLKQATNLRWYQQWGAGTDWLMRSPEIAARDFILTNASGVHAIPISEHILAFMLAFARALPQAIRNQEKHLWDRAQFRTPFELAGKTMLLVGVGAIGRRTAQSASALGMHVIGVRNHPEKTVPGVERMVGPDDMESVLPEADFLVLTIPLTSKTRQMINAQTFAKMKPSAYLINIGRGGTVDENALVEALQSGKIAGAGLDVFATEPLPADSPLWDMENVIITAHYSGGTPHYAERAMAIFLENLKHYTKGEPMINVVDKQRGY